MSRMTTPRRPRRWLPAAATAGWLLSATRTEAHTTFPGLGEYASGFLHPLTTPPHLLILLALGLWLGQQAPLRIKQPSAVFAVAALVGLLLAAAFHIGAVYPALLIAIGFCVGVCVATALPVPLWVRLGTCAVAAFVLGLDSGVDAGVPPGAAVKIMCATWASLVLCVVNAAFYVSLLPASRPWQIGVRVAGSWIVAVALLLLAFALRR